VRWFDTARLRNKLRITIGTPEENATLVRVLRQIALGSSAPAVCSHRSDE
jgi:histidinol-phosphate/aromatic aminotransferase/cobyric acid decarboxylase-like protein